MSKKLLIFFAGLLIIPSFIFSADFTAKGIWGGWAKRVVEAPSAPGTFYAASYGIFKSTDGGQTWTRKPAPVAPEGVGTGGGRHMDSSVAVSPTNANLVVVGDEQWCPIWVSTNGAESFTAVTLGSELYANFKKCSMVASSLYNGNYFFASIEKQTWSGGTSEPATLYMTKDAGTTWTTTGLTVTGAQTITDVLQIPSGKIIASVVNKRIDFWPGNTTTPTSGNIYFSDDSGTSFISSASFTSPISKMTWDATNNKIWGITFKGEIYNSSDWNVMVSSITGYDPAYPLTESFDAGILYSNTIPPSMIAFSNSNFATPVLVYRSTDAAGRFPSNSWYEVTISSGVGKELIDSHIEDIVVDSRYTDGSHWGLGTVEGGFYYTTATPMGVATSNEFFMQTGIDTTGLYYGIKEKNTSRIIAQSWNNLYLSEDNGSTWNCIYPRKGVDAGSCRYATIDPANSQKIYLTSGRKIYYTVNNGGDYFENTPLFDFATLGYNSASQYLTNLLVNPSSPTVMYVGIANDSAGATLGKYLYKSTNGGASWSQVSSLDCHGIIFIAMDMNEPDTIYAACSDQALIGGNFLGNGDGLFRSIDGGTTWTNLGFQGTRVSLISLDPDRPNYIVIGYQMTSDPVSGFTSHSAVSTNKGTTWKDLYKASSEMDYDVFSATAPVDTVSLIKFGDTISFLVGDYIYSGDADGLVYMAGISTNVGVGPLYNVTTLPTQIRWIFKGSTYATTGSGLYSLNLTLPSRITNTGTTTYSGGSIKMYNYPNPFNPRSGETSIKLSLPATARKVKIKIYSLSGDLVCEDTYNNYAGGFSYIFTWDGKNKKNELCAPGVYFAVADVDNKKVKHKIVIIR
ncbi:MAG: T9SS type A sorting domain-containing protein [Elusimicrobia bacterium]|nr:T9SS type A sorting domain-containing protein [Elusimicrobiota bacterium]